MPRFEHGMERWGRIRRQEETRAGLGWLVRSGPDSDYVFVVDMNNLTMNGCLGVRWLT